MPPVSKLLEQVLATYGKMSGRAKIVLAVSLAVVGGGLIYIMAADHTSYTPLFTGLSIVDASKITEELKKSKIPFRIEAGGTAVLVPEEKVHETRLSMAGQGLPRGGGVGFEIFDSQKFGISDFAQQVNYRRALQGEMERTISQLDAVKVARIHIALPKHRLFARQQRPVSASVSLRLHPGRALSRPSVKSIVHLVSSAVSDLSPDQVTVVDTSGTLLWSGRQGSSGGSGPLEHKQNMEETLERRLRELLNAAVGPGRSVVKVTAELGMASLEQMDTQYDPEKAVIRSESSLEEKDEKGSPKAAGIPGVRGNLPGGPAPETGAGKAGSSRKRTTRNYEINKVVRKRVSPAGELQRLSVAVLVDSKALVAASTGGAKGAGEGKLKVDLTALEEVVKKAVGFSKKRGDRVTLQAVPFVPTAELDVEPGNVVTRFVEEQGALIWPALGIIGGIVVLIYIKRWLNKRKRDSEVVDLPKTVQELEVGAAGQPLALGAGDVQARDLANAVAEHDTGRAAAVVRSWLVGG
jgi:flagellar M-ring protein FliF